MPTKTSLNLYSFLCEVAYVEKMAIGFAHFALHALL